MRGARGLKPKLGAAVVLLGGALLWAAAAYAVPAHYTDGTTFGGKTNFGEPPMNPHFVVGGNCRTDVIDPPSFAFITEHFVYGTTPPPAGVVPVHDDRSIVVPYRSGAPGTVTVNISAEVQGNQGFWADTWNLGTGVTAWVPFDCRDPASSTATTVASQERSVAPSSAMTAPMASSGSTTTNAPAQLAVAAANGQLPFTGGDTQTLLLAAVALIAVGGHLVSRYRRTRA